MFTRTLSRWFLMLFGLLCLSLFIRPDTAYACSCAPPPTDRTDLEGWYSYFLENSEVAFYGRVVDVVLTNEGTRQETQIATLDVYQMYKGEQASQFVFHVETILIGATCGYGFNNNTNYLVFARPSTSPPGTWGTGSCSGNEMEPSAEILAAMDRISQEGYEPPNTPDAPENECVIPQNGPWPPCAIGDSPPPDTGTDCVIPSSGPWPDCATGGDAPPDVGDDCVIPQSGPWPDCATGGSTPPDVDDGCVIPSSGPWPPCATGGGFAYANSRLHTAVPSVYQMSSNEFGRCWQ